MSANTTPPAELSADERVAMALFLVDDCTSARTWHELPDYGKDRFRDRARAAVTAYEAARELPAASLGDWDAQAYAAMRDDLESWKQRALTAEADVTRLCAEFNAENGPTFMGEPVIAQYEWFDAKATQWKPISRLPYTWECELVIKWRSATTPSTAGSGDSLPRQSEGGCDDEREVLGQLVRLEWMGWAREQPVCKPSWLVPWEELSEPDREVDRRIGERIAYAVRKSAEVSK